MEIESLNKVCINGNHNKINNLPLSWIIIMELKDVSISKDLTIFTTQISNQGQHQDLFN